MSDSIYYYAHNKMMSDRFEDLLKKKPQKQKTAQEILDETVLKAGLTMKR